jgi:CheY-like chemotaxis protein
MESQAVNSIVTDLAWLGGIAVTLLSLFGVGKIVEMLLARFFTKKDVRTQTIETNAAESLRADAQFRADLIRRVEKLEEEQRVMQGTLLSQAVENKALTVENEHLKRQNDQQEQKLERLRTETKELRAENRDLRGQLHDTKLDLANAVFELKSLSKDIERLKMTHGVEIEKEVLKRLSAAKDTEPDVQVAIIENNPDALDLLTFALSRKDLKVVGFHSGAEALDWLQQKKARVVVVDLAMGGDLDGLTIIEKIRGWERLNGLPPAQLVIYTGQNIDEAIRTVIERQSVAEIFQKATHPPDVVCEAIERLLSSN